MKNCCKTCIHYQNSGYCGFWEDYIKDILGTANDMVGVCSNFEDTNTKDLNIRSDTRPSGDNFPNYDTIHLRLLIHRERREMIEKLVAEKTERITKDDIEDMMIDIELYNLSCKRKKKE